MAIKRLVIRNFASKFICSKKNFVFSFILPSSFRNFSILRMKKLLKLGIKRHKFLCSALIFS